MMNQQTLQVLEEGGLSSRRCMKSCRESRKEPATPTTLLTTRKTLNIGTWNIRTMFESGKTAQVAREMHNYNLALLGRWLGHTLRKPPSNISRQALNWNPQGQRKRGRPRNTWRRELEKDIKRTGHTWKQLEGIAQDRGDWRVIVGGLCSGRSKGPKYILRCLWYIHIHCLLSGASTGKATGCGH